MKHLKRINIAATDFLIDTEKRSYSGYGVVFNSDSHPFSINENGKVVKVFEQIRKESLDRIDFSDVVVSFNHNEEKILGRSSSGTARFEIDDKGVRYIVDELPNTSYANDLLESSQRGDISGSSFWFIPNWEAGFEFEKRADGNYNTYPKVIDRVVEMGPVVFPAYPETTAELRSAFQDYLKKEINDDQQPDLEAYHRNLNNKIQLTKLTIEQ